MKAKAIQLSAEELRQAQIHETVTKVFNKEGDRLFSFIRNRVPTQEDAEDIFQEVFFQYTDAITLAQDIRNGGAWVFRVARNKIVDFFRKHKTLRLDDMKFQGNDDGDMLSLTDIIPAKEKGPEHAFMRKMVAEVIDQTLQELPKNQREVFEMHEFEGVSFKEMAEITGENENTLITRKRYAIVKLRENLKSFYNEMFND